MLSRKSFLKTTLACCLAPSILRAQDNPLAEPFDHEVLAFMKERQVPGGQLAVARHGKIIYAKGYGFSDRENQLPVENDSRFRIASISKPITAAFIIHLIEQKKLKGEEAVHSLLGLKAKGPKADERTEKITVAHLLHHTSGWDRDVSGDPMFAYENKAGRAGAVRSGEKPLGTTQELIEFYWDQPLDFAPGEKYAYSNYGYCLLGRIIEKVTGETYETATRKFLQGAGIRHMSLGKSRLAQLQEKEVKYYEANPRRVPSWWPEDKLVESPYGGFVLERMDAHGGWISSAEDLLRFVIGCRGRTLIKNPSLFETIPAPPVNRKPDGTLQETYYGWGWMVRPMGATGKPNLWHAGSLPGTSTLLVQLGNDVSWAVLFNQRSNDSKKPDGAIDGALHRAASKVKAWPE